MSMYSPTSIATTITPIGIDFSVMIALYFFIFINTIVILNLLFDMHIIKQKDLYTTIYYHDISRYIMSKELIDLEAPEDEFCEGDPHGKGVNAQQEAIKKM